MKYIILYENFLNESKELDIANKYKSVIPDNMFIILSKIDVTPTRKYLDKICNFFVNDKAPNNSKIENLHHVFTNFDHLTNKKIIKGADSDITKYKTLKDLASVVDKYSKIESELLEKKLKKANIIRIKDDKDLFICVPLDEETSKIYGSNTRWCVSAREDNRYKDYFADKNNPAKSTQHYVKLIGGVSTESKPEACFVAFIINKQLESSNPLHKMAIQFGLEDGDMSFEIFDSLDGTRVSDCIDKANYYKIELPQEYHDMMKKYGVYGIYIEKCLNINIRKLYNDIHDKYFPKKDNDTYQNYLNFLTLYKDSINLEDMHDIYMHFSDYMQSYNSDPIDDELKIFYNITSDIDTKRSKGIRIPFIDYFTQYISEIDKFCKKHNLKNPIKKINYNQIFDTDELEKIKNINKKGTLDVTIDSIIIDSNLLTKLDDLNIDNNLNLNTIYLRNIKKIVYEDDVKLKNLNNVKYEFINTGLKDDKLKIFKKIFCDKYSINPDNVK